MFKGSMVALVTPMRANGDVDYDALARLVEWHIEQGTDAIVSVGTTGESATLDNPEHIDVIRETIRMVNGRIPVIAGTGANSTREAIHLTGAAANVGADACLIVVPYYNKPTQQGLYEHYKTIAKAVDIPQILYNVPGRTACDMLPETVARLMECENIIGLKEATASLPRIRELLERCGDRMEIYSGDDAVAKDIILMGGLGVISVTANVAPKLMHDMCMAALDRNVKLASALDAKLAALHRDLFIESNPIPVKWALQEMGHIPAGLRLPMTPLSKPCHETLRAALRQAGSL